MKRDKDIGSVSMKSQSVGYGSSIMRQILKSEKPELQD